MAGVLSGKYSAAGAHGRVEGELDRPRYRETLAAAGQLRELAQRLDTAPATLAIAFCLANPRVASVLFGATSAEQVAENSRAVELLARLSETDLTEVRAIGV